MDKQAEMFEPSHFACGAAVYPHSSAKRTGCRDYRSRVPARTARMALHALQWIAAAVPTTAPLFSLSDLRWLDTDPAVSAVIPYAPEQHGYAVPVISELMAAALSQVDARTRHIVTSLHLLDDPLSLSVLGALHGLLPEQVRQIDERAFAKIRRWMRLTIAERRRLRSDYD